MIQDMVNQNVQDIFKKFQDNKNREFEKAQEEIKETIEDCINTKVKQRT
jgi:NAD(P)H-dependent FMN reductase